jgi:predicted phage-related endonuclease
MKGAVLMYKNETLAKKIAEREDLKDKIDVLKYKMEQLDTEFKDDITERGVDTYEFEFDGVHHKISYKVSTMERFDTKRFKEEKPEEYVKYIKVSPTSRLTVK